MVYFAVRAFINFATGGLLNLVAVQAFVVGVILLGLRSRHPRVTSGFKAIGRRPRLRRRRRRGGGVSGG